MKNLIITSAALMFISGTAMAAGSHSGGHNEMAVGEPGKRGEASKTVVVEMSETDDGKMLYTPDNFEVEKGQTIHFVIKNKGELEHEFVLDDHEANKKHKAEMAKAPEMEHDNPNSVRLDPGKTGNVTWKFTNAGKFEFACLIPGHYESGMRGDVAVTDKSASN